MSPGWRMPAKSVANCVGIIVILPSVLTVPPEFLGGGPLRTMDQRLSPDPFGSSLFFFTYSPPSFASPLSLSNPSFFVGLATKTSFSSRRRWNDALCMFPQGIFEVDSSRPCPIDRLQTFFPPFDPVSARHLGGFPPGNFTDGFFTLIPYRSPWKFLGASAPLIEPFLLIFGASKWLGKVSCVL